MPKRWNPEPCRRCGRMLSVPVRRDGGPAVWECVQPCATERPICHTCADRGAFSFADTCERKGHVTL